MIPTPVRKRTREELTFRHETQRLDALVFSMLQDRKINPHQRDTASDRLTQARLLAASGHFEDGRQIVDRVKGMIAEWLR